MCMLVADTSNTYETRMRSESAYICQVNLLQLLHKVGEEDGAPLKPSLYLEPFSK